MSFFLNSESEGAVKKNKEIDMVPPGAAATGHRSRVATPKIKGLWFLVLRHLERDHVSYFPMNHHLVVENRVPDKVPSMGGVKGADNMIPTDKSGMINLEAASPKDIVALVQNGTIRPVQMDRRMEKILAEGRAANLTTEVDLVPGMKRIVTHAQKYEQATGVQYTPQGMDNRRTAERMVVTGR